MDLPNLFTVNVAQAGQRICVLVLTDRSVLAGLVVVHPSGSELLSISEQIPYTDDASLLISADEVLQELGKESEDVNEVVFCLEQGWFDGQGELVAEKQALLKKIKEELSLQPVGYVLQHETITEHLINQQKQLSGLILFVSTQGIVATLVVHGAISTTKLVGRSTELQSDVVEALSQVGQEIGGAGLPGKLLCATIALEVSELFELQQELLTVVWPETVQFLQAPVIDVIKPQLCAQVVVVGAGKALEQLEGGVVADSGDTALPVAAGAAVAGAVLADGARVENIEAVAEELAVEPATASTFGIPVNPSPTVTFAQSPEEEGETALAEEHHPVPPVKQKDPLLKLKKIIAHPTKLQLIIGGLLACLVGLLVVACIGFIYLRMTSVLELTIVPKTQLLTEEVSLTLDTNLTETDVANKKIRADKLEVTVTGSKETQASGIQIVGDKATGTVVLFNKTSASKSFPAGTQLKADKNMYLLDEAVEVPAATISAKPGGTGEEKEYGQRSVKAMASVLGVESNIDKDVALTVAEFDANTYSAKTETPMSGGSSREVQVVSKVDLDLLVSELKKELLASAKEQLDAQQSADQRVIQLDNLVVQKQSFSAKEGDEVDSVSLEMTGVATGLAYKPTELEPIATALLSGSVPPGYSLDGHTPQILSAGTASGSSQVTLSVNLSSKAHALVETEQLRTQLASQPLEQATSSMQGDPAIESVTFFVIPSLAKGLVTAVPSDERRFRITLDIGE